jgi:hypothetical protein
MTALGASPRLAELMMVKPRVNKADETVRRAETMCRVGVSDRPFTAAFRPQKPSAKPCAKLCHLGLAKALSKAGSLRYHQYSPRS